MFVDFLLLLKYLTNFLSLCMKEHAKSQKGDQSGGGLGSNKGKRKVKYFCVESPPCLHDAGSEVYLKHGKKEKKGKIDSSSRKNG